MVAADNMRRGSQRVGFVENGVGDGDSEVGDGPAMNEIAKVDDPDNALIARINVVTAIDNDVVVIGVVLYHAAA